MSKETSVTVGTPFAFLLGLLFVALKLTGHIDWSWWWVTSPFWIPPALVLTALALFLALSLVFGDKRRA